jgi:hypothetical protein
MKLNKIESTNGNLHITVALTLEILSQSVFNYLNVSKNTRYTNTIFYSDTIENRSFVDVTILLLLYKLQYNETISNDVDAYIEKAKDFANHSFTEIGNDKVIELYNKFVELYSKEISNQNVVPFKRPF